MKYMGSKRVMLQNGLGELLRTESKTAERVVDLFCGAASVSWFSAITLNKPVISYDLQEYAAIMAGAVVQRARPVDVTNLEKIWLESAKRSRAQLKGWAESRSLDSSSFNIATWRKRAQELCESGIASENSLIFNRYGAYYFSPTQSLAFDAMIRTLPEKNELRIVCIAATIAAASRCAASPGHTAQPFKATRSAGKYLRDAWKRDPFYYAANAIKEISPLHAQKKGQARVGDANQAAKRLKNGDLVFVDPPYSGVHYSRFYHVLETIARGRCGPVEGTGRYPPLDERPASLYSQKANSKTAMTDLLTTLSANNCTVILTYPQEECSNGLSGNELEILASEHFEVAKKTVKTRFSTLGGNAAKRAARKVSDELILVLRP